MISPNKQGLVVHLLGSWGPPPPLPFNTHRCKTGSGGLAFLPPTERIWKGRQSFPFSSFTVRFLDQCNPRTAATRVQRFGCSLTTNLTTKQCNGFRWKRDTQRIFYTSRKDSDSVCQATDQHPLKKKKSKKPDPSPVQTALGSLKLFSVFKWKMCLGTVQASRQSRTEPRARIHTAALWTSLATIPATVGQNSCCVLTLSLPHPLMLSRSAIICYAPTQTRKNRPPQSTDEPSHSVLKPWHHDHLTSAWNQA